MPAVSNDSRLQMQRVQNYNSVFGCCHRSKENHLIPNNFLSGQKKTTSILTCSSKLGFG